MSPDLERRPARGPRDVSRHAARLAEEFARLYRRHGPGVAYTAEYGRGEPQLRVQRKALRIADCEAKLGVRAAAAPQPRAVPAAPSSGPMLRGLAIVFDSLSVPIAGFRERIRPEAIRRTFDEGLDVRAFADHDPGKVLGRLSARTLGLHVDGVGLHVSIALPDTSYANDLRAVVARRDLDGMSFGFSVVRDEWTMENGMPIRSVLDMRIAEVSVVALPAYLSTVVTTT